LPPRSLPGDAFMIILERWTVKTLNAGSKQEALESAAICRPTGPRLAVSGAAMAPLAAVYSLGVIAAITRCNCRQRETVAGTTAGRVRRGAGIAGRVAPQG